MEIRNLNQLNTFQQQSRLTNTFQCNFQNHKPTKYLSASLIYRSQDNQSSSPSLGRMACALRHLRLGRTLQILIFWSKFNLLEQNMLKWHEVNCWLIQTEEFVTILVCGKKWCTEKSQKCDFHIFWLKVRPGADEIWVMLMTPAWWSKAFGLPLTV